MFNKLGVSVKIPIKIRGGKLKNKLSNTLLICMTIVLISTMLGCTKEKGGDVEKQILKVATYSPIIF